MNKWCARLKVNYKIVFTGYFINKEDAAKAYELERSKYFSTDQLKPLTRYEADKIWRNNNPEKIMKKTQKYRKKNREALNKDQRERGWKTRLETISVYGGKCECCNESNPEFLCIDHVDGGGGQERRSGLKSGYNMYIRLKKSGYPKDKYRVLCYNCNSSIGMIGYCPHKMTREQAKLSGKLGRKSKIKIEKE